MKKFSKSKKVISIFLLILFMNNFLFPYYSWALSSEPIQVDYTDFEEPGTTDMVQLSTGNFNYNIPLLTVPTPDGKGFTVPISYHPPTNPDEDASWVGLGWSLNCGAITRQQMGYNDDANNEAVSQVTYSDIGHGYTRNNFFYVNTWDSNSGKGGVINFGIAQVGFGTQSGVNALGYSYNGNTGKSSYDWGKSLVAIGEAAITIASYGAFGTALGAATSLFSTATSVLTMATAPSLNYSDLFTNDIIYKSEGNFLETKNKYYYNTNKTTYQFGAIYLGNMTKHYNTNVAHVYNNNGNSPYDDSYSGANCFKTTINQSNEVLTCEASDMYKSFNDNSYKNENVPTGIAYDNFHVLGNGVSGQIFPYRLDQGSLAFPVIHGAISYNRHDRIIGSPYVKNNPNDFSWETDPELNYKPQFIYKNQFSNNYDWNNSPNNTGGIDLYFTNNQSTYNTANVNFINNRYYTSSERIEGNRTGLVDGKLSSEKHVAWYTNNEIKLDRFLETQEKGQFLDFKNSTARVSFRNALSAPEGIGGFSITRSDGYTYHYALPVYSWNNVSAWFAIPTISGQHYSYSINNNKVAHTWLLTAITGPDFVDIGEEGIVDQADEGYWIKFDYGKFSSQFNFRSPYIGYYTEPYLSQTKCSYSKGTTERYYLKTIRTKSHVAMFVLDNRFDGKGAFKLNSSHKINKETISQSLRLSDIYLFKAADFDNMNLPVNTGIYDFHNLDDFNQIYDKEEMQYSSSLSAIISHQIKHIHFNYNYSLCDDTPNSFDYNYLNQDNNTGTCYMGSVDGYASLMQANGDYFNNYRHLQGSSLGRAYQKMSLGSISIYGFNENKLFPDYKFEYSNNTNYSQFKVDGWGAYCLNGSSELMPTNEGPNWVLNKITTPLGGTINVNYEKDTYSNVCEYPVSGYMTYNNANPTELYFTSDNTLFTNAVHGNSITCHFSVRMVPMTYQHSAKTVDLTVDYVDLSNNRIVFQESIPVALDFPYQIENKVIVNDHIVRYGGDHRVSSIIYKDELNNEYKTRYIYENNGYSYGFCSVEPEKARCKLFLAQVNIPPYDDYKTKLFEFPMSPVVYSKVIVLNGKLENDNDFETKTEYNFQGSTTNEISYNSTISSSMNSTHQNAQDKEHTITCYSRIGRILSIISKNNKDQKIGTSIFEYVDDGSTTEHGEIGQYMEKSYCIENNYFDDDDDDSDNGSLHKMYFKISETLKKSYPNILKKIINTDTYGNTMSISNSTFDLITGIPDNSIIVNNGVKTKKNIVFAYNNYSGMESKVNNSQNRNLLTVPYKTYISKYNVPSNRWDMLSAEVTTWDYNWKKREFLSGYGNYGNVSNSNNVYRVFEKWVWNGQIDHETGVYMPLGESNWKANHDFNSSSAEWIKVAKMTQYNRFSVNTENLNVNTNYNSKKTDLNDEKIIATAQNSPYCSMTHSSFETSKNIGLYRVFEGEFVEDKNSPYTSIDWTKAHTGIRCIKLIGGLGPKFKVYNNYLYDWAISGKYRASVWVHESSPVKTSLNVTYEYNNNTVVDKSTMVSESQININGWKLVTLDFDVPDTYNSYFNVYVENTNGSIAAYFDDLRVQPIDATVTGYVFNSKDQIVATLDNENIATFYYYDDAGRLIRTEREFPGYGVKKMAEYNYHYARQNE